MTEREELARLLCTAHCGYPDCACELTRERIDRILAAGWCPSVAAALAEAEERGRAAGWREAKEAAAQIAEGAVARKPIWGTHDPRPPKPSLLRTLIVDAIRALPDPSAAAPVPSKVWPAPGIMENWQHPDDRPQQVPAPPPLPMLAPAVDPAVLAIAETMLVSSSGEFSHHALWGITERLARALVALVGGSHG